MTFKSLMNFGGYKDSYYPNVDRYHSGPGGGYHHSGSGGYHHSESGGYHHSSRGGKGKGGDKGAALSALTLLAFLFLLNVMQQSMQDQNSMITTTAATIVLRDNDQPVVVDAKEEKENAKREETKRVSSYRTPAKSKIQRLNSQYIK
ncbi:uncharacterized protein LOC132907441 [Bombus pascuorum]|uniref:uncharacterized protein LOC132907441 n=1 Tax=Bombus pascuorum TaxID=65598 RepID=UPI0021337208|nr:uncharacterized protein LOC132907441 [Bombus pascuorum]